MKKNHIFFFIYAFPPLFLLFFFLNKEIELEPGNQYHSTNSSGKDLAMRYCQMCHIYPDPSLLDKETWTKDVLPNMGMRLGIKHKGQDPYKTLSAIDKKITKELNIYPDTPLISKTDWESIVEYYNKEAPKKLPSVNTAVKIDNVEMPFKPHFLNVGEAKLPKVSLLKFNDQTSELFVGDYQKLYAIKWNGDITGNWIINSPATHMEFRTNLPPLVSTIGNFGPSDQKKGILSNLYLSENKNILDVHFSNLKRPVYFASADLNMDNNLDLIVCNFGNYNGKLSWYENFDQSKEHVLTNQPGARRVEIKDMNGDQKPDIVVLMAQAYEQLVIYYNKGNGIFEREKVLEFPPTHGVSYFEMADFNGDGFEDVLISNGDNWDFSKIEKPYHGLRIFLNDKKNNFSSAFFYPMFGCSKAMARDFDNDGDLDIVASSFYTDLKDPKKSFVYLTNNGHLDFTASYLPEAAYGKWMTMEVGDINNDGFLDVMLGSFLMNFTEMGKVFASTGSNTFPQVLLLTQSAN
ncbi:FG-GAP repeat domain-containing protein [Maribacter sp. HTCC2170]|uniref:FG-GAP repeat domain-containing protein n=1 Tax=Maribacter sp. (strain HTCC2170 / KCCM 42371) TaxID=313603 RepID=UPI00006B3AD8|nr:VCBS repeat-containing protein [Maribacter sp. HTCC2170]EAQ99750.1 hypothetical protein FB2170_07339 [Maribacter sp. HTCC2170]